MKANTSLRGKVYSKLIRKLFLQTFAVLGAAAVLVLLLRAIVRGKLADSITQIISLLWRMDIDSAASVYQYYIRNNLDYIIIVLMVIFFFIFFRLLLTWFTRYFDQIVHGVDELAQEKDSQIVMCPELEFMETKLNEVKGTLKQRREEVQQAEQRKNDLVVYLAHDVKTPLTSVIGYLSLLNENENMPAHEKSKYLNIALEKANQLKTLINQFFEITRYNLQAERLVKEHIDLYYLMMQVSDELYPQLIKQGQTVSISIAEDLSVVGDAEKLARVFNNLLKNAIAYSPANSIIEISATALPHSVSIVFKNEGTIPQDKLNAIFDKFYRLDASRSSSTGGAGLGLAIAKDIVSLHGGQIKADSANGYSSFSVELPSPAAEQ